MKTITENNKILAEFLGWKQYPIKGKSNGYEVTIKEGYVPIQRSASSLEFHTDWNWLMAVIRKIEQLPNIYDEEMFLLIRDEIITGRIEETYSSVVDFVEWYNENGAKRNKKQ